MLSELIVVAFKVVISFEIIEIKFPSFCLLKNPTEKEVSFSNTLSRMYLIIFSSNFTVTTDDIYLNIFFNRKRIIIIILSLIKVL